MRKITLLVPGTTGGGISRLFANVSNSWAKIPTENKICVFYTHGKPWVSLAKFPIRLFGFLIHVTFSRPDLCHINLSKGGSTARKWIYASICRLFGIPYVIHLHGGHYPNFFRQLGKKRQTAVLTLFNRAVQIIVLGEIWRDFVVQEIGVNPHRITVLPNAVSGPDAVDVRMKHVPIHILFLGKLCPEKGTGELLNALGSETVCNLEWNATIAGNGAVLKYKALAESLGIQKRVGFPGWVDPVGTEELLGKSSILVLPSHAENLPLCILEAMAFGVCPVATPVGAIPDVISDGHNGFIVPVGDIEKLSSTIAFLLSNIEECQRAGMNARELFKSKYDINRYVHHLDEFYSKVEL